MTYSGAKIFEKAAKENAPEKTGRLKKAIVTHKIKASELGVIYYVTIARRMRDKVTAPHAHLVEFGTAPHFIPKFGEKLERPLFLGGKGMEGRYVWRVEHPGAEKHPFMRPAFDENAERVVVKMGDVMKKKLEKWTAKYQAVSSLYGLPTSIPEQ
jgi:HK97 gp10 family phage protein